MSELVLKNSDLSKGLKIKHVKELFYIKGLFGWRVLKKSDFIYLKYSVFGFEKSVAPNWIIK